MAFTNNEKSAQWFAEADSIMASYRDGVPPTFYHYAWASEHCEGKKVVELDCRAGIGTMLLADVATACTGLDTNIEAVKYAQRNCHIEGKTRFGLLTHDLNYSEYDVVVSFNGDSVSVREIIGRLASSSDNSITAGNRGQKPTLLVAVTTGSSGSAAIRELTASIPATAKPSFYLQSSRRPQDITALREPLTKESGRILAAIEFSPDKGKPKPHLKESMDLVSIVIPTYNREDFVAESVESALNQTYDSIEVIVVDDGSTDDTRAVLEKYGDRIKYYYKENGGIGSALNFGIKKMNGRWFKWLSSDDVLTPDAVELLVAHANSTGALITYTDYDIIDDRGSVVRRFVEPHYSSYYEFASALWTRFIGNGSSVLIEKSCFDNVGLFDESLRSGEDYDWWLRACLLQGYRFFYLDKVTLKYRTHGTQLTSSVKHNAYVNAEKIRNKVRADIISVNPGWWDTLKRYQKEHAKQNRKGGLARRLLRRSLLHMPEGMRKSALRTWHDSVKPKIDDNG